MSEGKTVSHLQIQDSGAKILYFITILKIIGFLKLERNDIDVSIIFRSNINDILSCHFKRDQIKTNISVKVKVLENCLCRECSMSTTLLEFLH